MVFSMRAAMVALAATAAIALAGLFMEMTIIWQLLAVVSVGFLFGFSILGLAVMSVFFLIIMTGISALLPAISILAFVYFFVAAYLGAYLSEMVS